MKKIILGLTLVISMSSFADHGEKREIASDDNGNCCSPQVLPGPCNSYGDSEVTIISCNGNISKTRQSCTPKIVYDCTDKCRSNNYYVVYQYLGYDRRTSGMANDIPSFSNYAACKEGLASDSRCN